MTLAESARVLEAFVCADRDGLVAASPREALHQTAAQVNLILRERPLNG